MKEDILKEVFNEAEKSAFARDENMSEKDNAGSALKGVSAEQMDRLISLIRESAAENKAQAEMLKNILSPQENISGEDPIFSAAFEKRVAPILREVEELKEIISEFYQKELARSRIEEDRATHELISEMTAKYPDFEPKHIGEQMKNYVEMLVDSGMDEKAAVNAVKILFDNRDGVEKLYFLSALGKNPEIFSKSPRVPDEHISGSSSAVSRGWRQRLKSGDKKERDSVINDLF